MKKVFVWTVGLMVALLVCGCGMQTPEAPTETNSSSASFAAEEITTSPAAMAECPDFLAEEYTSPDSLSALIEEATGRMPSSTNACFAIFNMSHGNMTNMLYIKNGWAMLNLPVEVFVPWAEDRFVVGSPKAIADKATVDGDTVVIDGGIINFRQNGEVVDMVDWSTVSGGVYVNSVRFESSRMKIDETGQRFWTATCNGETFSGNELEQALACGRGE